VNPLKYVKGLKWDWTW